MRNGHVPRRCKHTKLDGSACRAKAQPGKSYCMFHDPSLAERRAQGRKQGGINRCKVASTLPLDTPDLPLDTVKDVVAMLAQTMNQVRTGKVAVQIGNCLGVLAGVLLKALEGSDLERRMAVVEENLSNNTRSLT